MVSYETLATIDRKGSTFTIARGAWVSSYPLAHLPKWIAFYRRQAELFPSQSSYIEDVRALEALRRRLTNT